MKKCFTVVASLLSFSGSIIADFNDSTRHNPRLNDSLFTLREVFINAPATVYKNSNVQMNNTEIQKNNFGQNLPYLFASTPACVVTSDDGLGVGYTALHIRGVDPTRINVTVNNISLNDQESQNVFWVNLTDLGASFSQLDIQRGVGTTANGTAAFGASINANTLQPFLTNDTAITANTQIAFNGGMYNTFKEMLKAKLQIRNMAIQLRLSKTNSNGYIERAKSDLFSYLTGLQWQKKQKRTNNLKTSVQLTAFGGTEKTYMAWYGIDEQMLKTNRRFNPAGLYINRNGDTAFYDNQTDNYQQHHLQLALNQQLPKNGFLKTTLHYTYGKGYYEQLENAENNTTYDVVQKKMENHFCGGIIDYAYRHNVITLNTGISLNHYKGRHYGLTTPFVNDKRTDDWQKFYEGYGHKTDGGVYAKLLCYLLQQPDQSLCLFTDLHYRYINYTINGDNSETYQPIQYNRVWHFFNPKSGLLFNHKRHTLTASVALTHREPTRTDIQNQNPQTPCQRERLTDAEIGYNINTTHGTLGTNIYFMYYHDQLIRTGALNSEGAPLAQNVKYSFRTGIEIFADIRCTRWLKWNTNLTFAQNKWLNENDNTWHTISYSPDWIANNELIFSFKNFNVSLINNVVSRQFSDNEETETAVIPPYTTTNLHLRYNVPFAKNKIRTLNLQLMCMINNILNTEYISNATTYKYMADNQIVYSTYYFPQAGINVHAGFTLSW